MQNQFKKTIKTSVQDVSEKKGIVTIQITQFDKYDSDKDRLLTGSLTKTWNEGSQVHLVNHQIGTGTLVGLPVSKDATTGIIESQLNLNKQVAKDLLADYVFCQKHGRSLQHSHGFYAIKDKYSKNERGGYDFAEVKQFEYSTVIFGAVSDTPLIGVKSKKKDIVFLIEELELKLKTCNYSDSYGKIIESKIIELKTLINEPSKDTQETIVNEPIVITQKTNDFFNKLNF